MGSGGRGAEEVRIATRIVNRALSALRAGARDPLVQDIGATRALAVRLGRPRDGLEAEAGTADIVVALERSVAEPRGPNAVCDPMPPNAPARSAAFPLCSNTTMIRKRQTTT